jgi:L-methionine (R)-S-oxide reductase
MSGITLPDKLREILDQPVERAVRAHRIAEAIRGGGAYRWVGIYEVDFRFRMVTNIAWSGPSAQAYPEFPITKGLTSRAISEKRTINVGDVADDPGYLTALDSTRSEIIVPVLDRARTCVIGTIDVESEDLNAFDCATQSPLEECAQLLADLWSGGK